MIILSYRNAEKTDPHHMLKYKEHIVIFPCSLLQLYYVGMTQLAKDLQTQFISTNIRWNIYRIFR